MAFLFNIGTELTQEFIFIPLFLHLFLIYWLYIQLGSQKSKAFAAGLVDAKQTALNPKAWPESVVKISNNIGNQFETPIIFYVLCLTFYVTDSVNLFAIFLAAVYVASRFVHAYIHVTSNHVPHRMKVFKVGMYLLLLMTLLLPVLIFKP